MVRVYPACELPPEDVYVLEKMGYSPTYYSYVAIGLYFEGLEDIIQLFGKHHIITPKPDYADEPAVLHYALIGLK